MKEDVSWMQKVQFKWVRVGDCNSKLFHKVDSYRRMIFIKKRLREIKESSEEQWAYRRHCYELLLVFIDLCSRKSIRKETYI